MKHKIGLLTILDIIVTIFAYFFAIYLLYTHDYWDNIIAVVKIIETAILTILVAQIFFQIFDLYANNLLYETEKEYGKYIISIIGSAIIVAIMSLNPHIDIFGLKENVLGGLLTSILLVSYRISIKYQIAKQGREKTFGKDTQWDRKKLVKKNALIIGAGWAGKEVIETLQIKLKNKYHIIGIIDDMEEKQNCNILGVKVIGSREDILPVCIEENIDIIFFSISNVKVEDKNEILEICKQTEKKVVTLPSIQDMIKSIK